MIFMTIQVHTSNWKLIEILLSYHLSCVMLCKYLLVEMRYLRILTHIISLFCRLHGFSLHFNTSTNFKFFLGYSLVCRRILYKVDFKVRCISCITYCEIMKETSFLFKQRCWRFRRASGSSNSSIHLWSYVVSTWWFSHVLFNNTP